MESGIAWGMSTDRATILKPLSDSWHLFSSHMVCSDDKKNLIKDQENGMKKSASKSSVAKDSAV